MRTFSSKAHEGFIPDRQRRIMGIDDPALPAVTHLTGDAATDVLAVAVERAGGTLRDSRVSQIQYQPGRELVVRYRCDVDWPHGRQRRETLLAATTSNGHLAGAIPVVADTEHGELAVSVWRWPFDPVLPGLPTAVTGSLLTNTVRDLGIDVGDGPVAVDVVAYRPSERAVVRLRTSAGPVLYVKVVPPETAVPLAARHRTLRDAGLPVPEAIAVDEVAGLVVLTELAGTTLRDRVKQGLPHWPAASEFLSLSERLESAPSAGLPRLSGRLQDALGHGELLRTVAPELEPLLDHILDAVRAQIPEAECRPPAVIHGDLHEAQIIVEAGAITGLLDIDDIGVGDPLTDLATTVAHLRFRSLVHDDPEAAQCIGDYADSLHTTFAARAMADARALDISIAAVLVGLATGPFRIQRDGWSEEIATVLTHAADLVGVVVAT